MHLQTFCVINFSTNATIFVAYSIYRIYYTTGLNNTKSVLICRNFPKRDMVINGFSRNCFHIRFTEYVKNHHSEYYFLFSLGFIWNVYVEAFVCTPAFGKITDNIIYKQSYATPFVAYKFCCSVNQAKYKMYT